MDELGNWCQERLVGAPREYAQQEGFHGDPVRDNQPCQQPPTSTERNFSGNTHLTSNEGSKPSSEVM